jgi:hypothetical protein
MKEFISKIKFLCLLTIMVSTSFSASTFAQVRFGDESKIACHNCYEPQNASSLSDALLRIKAIELDIWDNDIASGFLGKIFKSTKMNSDWYVKHLPQTRGNKNNFGGNLSACLRGLKQWGLSNPSHEVITVFIDKKENWGDPGESRNPIDLDNLISSIFTDEEIFTSQDLEKRSSHKSPKKTYWPLLNEIEGKFIFVLTNGTELTDRNVLDEYVEGLADNAICFVAPGINQNGILLISERNKNKVSFINLPFTSFIKAETLENRDRLIVRVYNLPYPEKIEDVNSLKVKKIGFIALTNFKLF